MTKKNRRKKILDSQKLRNRLGLFAIYRHTLSLSAAAIIATLAILWIKPRLQAMGFDNRIFVERPTLTVISSLSDAERKSMQDEYQRISSVNAATLSQLTERLHQSLGLRSITLIRTGPQSLAIGSVAFSPALVVELDRRRFVTDDGIIFGDASAGEEFSIPSLRGLEHHSELIKSKNGTFSTSNSNQRIIADTLLAIQEGSKYNIKYRKLIYDDFRGISGELEGSNYRVTLGFSPFANKYMKLEKIIISLKERGLSSATIELDYKGKAFVKESVL